MDLGLTGKTALVLGAGGGLGGAIARTLAREGARVAVADLKGDAAEATAGAIRNAGGMALALAWDLGEIGSAALHIGRIEASSGRSQCW